MRTDADRLKLLGDRRAEQLLGERVRVRVCDSPACWCFVHGSIVELTSCACPWRRICWLAWTMVVLKGRVVSATFVVTVCVPI